MNDEFCSAHGIREEERTLCEIWTRVMGYYRPVSQFNHGKQSEYAERIPFKEADFGQ